jgi:hypothetical protein
VCKRANRTCAQCEHYIGCGDWDLCCKRGVRRLCNEDSDADDCEEFEQAKACRNVTSYVGMFRCSTCGFFCREDEVGDTCPRCGNEITGALWSEQRHYRRDATT